MAHHVQFQWRAYDTVRYKAHVLPVMLNEVLLP